MALNSLKDVYVDMLQDLYSSCKQSDPITGKLRDAAKNAELKDALDRGQAGIRSGMDDLTDLCARHGVSPDGEFCKGTEGLVKEARAHALEEDFGDEDAQDAMIIAQYQRLVHYAITGYGTAKAFAKRLGLDDDVATLDKMLDETYDGDERMTEIATTGGVNKAAA